METPPRTAGELKLLVRRALQVWPFVTVEDRLTLGAAACIMAVTSAANTGVAILLGQLVDRIQAGARNQYTHSQMYWAAGWILGTLAVIYVLREALNVVRRSFVETSVARLNRDMQLKLVGHALRGDLTSLSGEKVGALHGLLLKNCPLLILDEATSALDNISERHVQNAWGIDNSDRTTIIIAHRLTTLKNCDRILVFEDGRISAQGSYNELVAQNGLFAELVHSAETGPTNHAAPQRTLATAG